MKLTNNLKERLRKANAVMNDGYDESEYISAEIPNFYTKNINANDYTKNEKTRLRKEVRHIEKYRK